MLNELIVLTLLCSSSLSVKSTHHQLACARLVHQNGHPFERLTTCSMNKSSNEDVHVTELPLLSSTNVGVLSNAATHPWNSLHHPHPVTHHTAAHRRCRSHVSFLLRHLPRHHHQPVLMVASALAHVRHLMPHPASSLDNPIAANRLLLDTMAFLDQAPLLSNLVLPRHLSSSHSDG
jgi:hypothetical protein